MRSRALTIQKAGRFAAQLADLFMSRYFRIVNGHDRFHMAALHSCQIRAAWLTVVTVLIRLATPAAAQDVAGRVMLATAIDRTGRPTVDVGADDFVIEEGHDEREVLSVRVADYPIAVLIDNGASTDTALAAIRQAAARFITRIGQRPVAVGTLADP